MRHFVTSVFTASFLFTAWLPFSANAGSVYKWTDEEGVVHYGDIRPDNIETQEMKVRVGKGTSAPSTKKDNDAENSTTKQDNDSKQELTAEQKKAQEEACKTAKQNLEMMNTYARVRVKDKNGEYRYLTPEEKSKKMAQAQKFVDETCK